MKPIKLTDAQLDAALGVAPAMTPFEREWKMRIAAEATIGSLESRNPGGPLLKVESTAEEISRWLQWCDPNGCHLPELAEREGFDPYTLDDAWEALGQMVISNATPMWRAEYERAVADAMRAERIAEGKRDAPWVDRD